MNSQIILYSWTGNTAACAVALQQIMDVEPFLLVEEKERTGQKGFAMGGFQASIKAKAKLKALPVIKEDTDTLILGMPVWAGTTPPAINTFFKECSCNGKRVYAFVTQSSDNVPAKLEKRLKKLVEAQGGMFQHMFVLQVKSGVHLTVEQADKSAQRWAARIATGE